jgi:general transcription factor 3C protein 4
MLDIAQDLPFLRLLLREGDRLADTPDYKALSQAIAASGPSDETSDADQCPACGDPVGSGDASGMSKCTKGHEWSECWSDRHLSVTQAYVQADALQPASSSPTLDTVSVPLVPPSHSYPKAVRNLLSP